MAKETPNIYLNSINREGETTSEGTQRGEDDNGGGLRVIVGLSSLLPLLL